MTHGAAAKAARLSKDARPERYCSARGCLYRTGGGPCPRHAAQVTPRGEHEYTADVVSRISAYAMRGVREVAHVPEAGAAEAGAAEAEAAEAQTLAARVDAPGRMEPIWIIDPLTGEREALGS